MPRVFQVSVC